MNKASDAALARQKLCVCVGGGDQIICV